MGGPTQWVVCAVRVLGNALIRLDKTLQDRFDLTASQNAFSQGAEQVLSVFLAVDADEVCQNAQRFSDELWGTV